jgi:Ulp1 family protease
VRFSDICDRVHGVTLSEADVQRLEKDGVWLNDSLIMVYSKYSIFNRH